MTLVLGGARSGKSAVAEQLAAAAGQEFAAAGQAAQPPVTYLATMQVGDDPALADRVAVHQARRPADWRTVQVGIRQPALSEALPPPHPAEPLLPPHPAGLPLLPDLLREIPGPILLDSLGPWLASHDQFAVDTTGLCQALQARTGDTVIVSDEVGLGVVPSTAIGGEFRDALGTLNQAVSAVADRVFLVVAGRVLPLVEAPVR